MEDIKYILTDDTIEWKGRTLYRIQAVRDIQTTYNPILKGTMGGFVESEYNLSQEGTCWISPYARVYDNATVVQDAVISGSAEIFNNSLITSRARVCDNAKIGGCARILDDAKVFGCATVAGHAYVRNQAIVSQNAKLIDDSVVGHGMRIKDNALLRSIDDALYIGPIGSRDDFTTFYKTEDRDIWVCTGCFRGSLTEFEEAVRKEHAETTYESEYLDLIPYVKRKLG